MFLLLFTKYDKIRLTRHETFSKRCKLITLLVVVRNSLLVSCYFAAVLVSINHFLSVVRGGTLPTDFSFPLMIMADVPKTPHLPNRLFS
jgi:hypothetical protein